MQVWVGYARPDRQWEIPVEISPDTTVAVAIQRSGILAQCREISLADCDVGVFSKPVALDDLLEAGDRVEIYRSLEVDPKEARRRRAEVRSRRSAT